MSSLWGIVLYRRNQILLGSTTKKTVLILSTVGGLNMEVSETAGVWG